MIARDIKKARAVSRSPKHKCHSGTSSPAHEGVNIRFLHTTNFTLYLKGKKKKKTISNFITYRQLICTHTHIMDARAHKQTPQVVVRRDYPKNKPSKRSYFTTAYPERLEPAAVGAETKAISWLSVVLQQHKPSQQEVEEAKTYLALIQTAKTMALVMISAAPLVRPDTWSPAVVGACGVALALAAVGLAVGMTGVRRRYRPLAVALVWVNTMALCLVNTVTALYFLEWMCSTKICGELGGYTLPVHMLLSFLY